MEQPKLKPAPAPDFPLDANSASQNIPLSRIVPSLTNRKAQVDEGFIASIRQHGVLEPILVREIKIDPGRWRPLALKDGDSAYEIVCGERRWRGAQEAKLASIPAVVRKLKDPEAMELQIVENDQRENLSAIDRAEAYSRLRAQYIGAGSNETKAMEQIAAKVNREVRTVQQIIALGKLSRECQAALRQGEMEASHGYELCRRPEEEQLELLKWLRRETLYSQGDVPSVRRLKIEVRNMDIRADEKRRQENLFKEEVKGGQGGKSAGSAQTSAATPADKRTAAAIANYKPPSKAQLASEEKQREAEARSRRDYEHREKVQKVYTSSLFAAMAKKARINSRLLTHVVPNLLFEVWENEWPIDSFGQEVLGWPAPADQSGYSYNEVREYCDKHTRKFTPGVLASLLVALFASNNEQLARYFGVDLNKLRHKAAAAVKEEDAQAKLKAKGQGPKAGVRA